MTNDCQKSNHTFYKHKILCQKRNTAIYKHLISSQKSTLKTYPGNKSCSPLSVCIKQLDATFSNCLCSRAPIGILILWTIIEGFLRQHFIICIFSIMVYICFQQVYCIQTTVVLCSALFGSCTLTEQRVSSFLNWIQSHLIQEQYLHFSLLSNQRLLVGIQSITKIQNISCIQSHLIQERYLCFSFLSNQILSVGIQSITQIQSHSIQEWYLRFSFLSNQRLLVGMQSINISILRMERYLQVDSLISRKEQYLCFSFLSNHRLLVGIQSNCSISRHTFSYLLSSRNLFLLM